MDKNFNFFYRLAIGLKSSLVNQIIVRVSALIKSTNRYIFDIPINLIS